MINFVTIIFGIAIVLFSSSGIKFIEDYQSDFDTDLSVLYLGMLYYIVMILGIFSSERYRYLSGKIVGMDQIFSDFDFSYLFRALFISPLLFSTVITGMGRDANILMSFIFAFQNGFFWETVFSRQSGRDKLVAEHKAPS